MITRALVSLPLLGMSLTTVADPPSLKPVDAEEYVFEIHKYRLDSQTKLIGWRIRDDVYFGRRSADDHDFGFIWQTGDTQLSLTSEGIGWRMELAGD